jgi:hypothetical protein
MIEIPHKKIIVIGGQLKKDIVLHLTIPVRKDPSMSLFFTPKFQFFDVMKNGSMEFELNGPSDDMLTFAEIDCSLPLSEIVGQAEFHEKPISAIYELAYLKCLQCIYIEIQQRRKRILFRGVLKGKRSDGVYFEVLFEKKDFELLGVFFEFH